MKKMIWLLLVLLVGVNLASALGDISFPLTSRIDHNYDDAHMVMLLHMNNSANMGENDALTQFSDWDDTGITQNPCAIYSDGICANTTGGDFESVATETDNRFPFTAGHGLSTGGWVCPVAYNAGINDLIYKPYEGVGTEARFYTAINNNGTPYYRLGNSVDVYAGPVISTKTCNHFALIVNFTGTGNGTVSLYINATRVHTSTFVNLNKFTAPWTLAKAVAGNKFSGNLSEWFLMNRTINESELLSFANGTVGAGSSIGNMTVSATSSGVSLSIFNLSVEGDDLSTATGTITTGVYDNGTLFNITVRAPESYDITYLNQNSSSTFTANLTAIPRFYVDVRNIINDTFISEINATFSQGSESFTFTSTNGTLRVNLSEGIYNLTLSNKDHFSLYIPDTNYQNLSLTTYRVGQGKINLTLAKIFTRTVMYNWTASVGNVTNQSLDEGSSDDAWIYVNTGENNISVSGFNFSGGYVSFTLDTVLQNSSFVGNVSDTIFRFNVTDALTGGLISPFSITLINSSIGFSYTQTTTSGLLIFELENVTTKAVVSATNFSTANFTVVGSANITNQTFSLTRSNYLNLSVYYEPNRDPLLNGTINIIVLGASYAENQTIGPNQTNTSIEFDNVPSGDYEIRYFSEGFGERKKYVQIVDDIFVSTDLYLLDVENSTAITFTVKTLGGDFLENATVKALRGYIDLNAYLEVEACRTNFIGECQMGLVQKELGNPGVFYKIIIEYEGAILFETDPFEVASTTYSYKVDTGLVSLQDFNDFTDVVGNVSYVNTTGNFFKFVFSATDGLVSNACLDVKKKTLSGETSVGSTCLAASAGTITVAIDPSDESNYIATGSVRLSSGKYYPIDSEEINLNKDYQTFGLLGLAFVMIFVGTLGTLGAGNPAIAIVMFIIGLGGSALMGFMWSAWAFFAVLLILGGILFFKLRT